MECGAGHHIGPPKPPNECHRHPGNLAWKILIYLKFAG
jgi:hypothetical protein